MPQLCLLSQRKEYNALTRSRHGGYGDNLMGQGSEKHPLPLGLDLKNWLLVIWHQAVLKVNLMIENTSSRNMTIPPKAIVCQLNVANQIHKLVEPSIVNLASQVCKDMSMNLDNLSPGQLWLG